jgi:hypothetical protein
MRVTADNGGPWDLDVTIPVACVAPVDAAATVAIDDLDGNGAPEVAMVVRSPKGRILIKTRDAETGLKTASLPIAGPSWSLIDLETVPGMAGVVAALVRHDDGLTRVIVADLAGRTRMASLRYGATLAPVALAVNTRPGEPPQFAVLQATSSGHSRIVVRGIDGTTTGRRGFQVSPIDLESANQGFTDGHHLALLGTDDQGALVAFTFEPSQLSRSAWVTMGTEHGVDLEMLRGDDGSAILAILQQRGGEVSVKLVDPMHGAVLGTVVLPLATATDLEPVPFADGTETIAVLGVSGDGSPMVITDAERGRPAAGPAFEPAMEPIDLAVLGGHGPSGATIVALGSQPPTEAGITLWDPVTGEPLGSLRVP